VILCSALPVGAATERRNASVGGACAAADFGIVLVDAPTNETYLRLRERQFALASSDSVVFNCNSSAVLARLQRLRHSESSSMLVVGNGPMAGLMTAECMGEFDEVVRFNEFSSAISDRATIHVVNALITRADPHAWLILGLECFADHDVHPDLASDPRVCTLNETWHRELCAVPKGGKPGHDPSRGFLAAALLRTEVTRLTGFSDDALHKDSSKCDVGGGLHVDSHLVDGHHIEEEHRVLVANGLATALNASNYNASVGESIRECGNDDDGFQRWGVPILWLTGVVVVLLLWWVYGRDAELIASWRARPPGLPSQETLTSRHVLFHLGLFLISASLTTAASLIQPLSKNDDGRYEYSKASAVFLSEVLKLGISIVALSCQALYRWRAAPPSPPAPGEPPAKPPTALTPASREEWVRMVGFYAIPTLLYFANNNLAFTILEGISPATNMALGQSKVFFAAVLMWLLLKRTFSRQMLIGLVVLAIGLVDKAYEEGQSKPSNNHLTKSQALCISLAILAAAIGALAGVATEKFLKELKSSIHLQNVIAYTWGSALNFAFVYIDGSSREIVQRDGFLAHYNKYTWWYVVVQAFMGLSVSFIFKYQDNIARSFAVGTSMAFTLFLSAPVFDDTITFGAVISIVIICISLFVYYDGQARHQSAPPADPALPAESKTAPLMGVVGEGEKIESSALLPVSANSTPPPKYS